jgi:hypothetical protein
MARTLKELSKQLREAATNLPVRANQLKRDVASTVNFDLLQTTPVDTGLAVSNWQVQNNAPASEPRPAFVPSPEGRMRGPKGSKKWTHHADIEATRQANIAPALQVASETIGESKPGEPIHITNVLPYIQALDEGYSSQAQNFVERAILLAEDRVSRAKLV